MPHHSLVTSGSSGASPLPCPGCENKEILFEDDETRLCDRCYFKKDIIRSCVERGHKAFAVKNHQEMVIGNYNRDIDNYNQDTGHFNQEDKAQWRNMSLSYSGFHAIFEVFVLPGKTHSIHVLKAIVRDNRGTFARAHYRIEDNLTGDD